MRIAKRIDRRTKKTVQSCLFLGLCILEISFASASANQSILFPTRFELQAKQEAPVQSQPTDSKEKMTFQLSLISDGYPCPIYDLKCADSDIWWKDFALLASDGHALHLTSIPFPDVERSKKHFQS